MISPAAIEEIQGAGRAIHKPVDAKTGFEITAEFQRFNQKYDMFNRAVWDDSVRSERSRKFFESYFTDLAEFRAVEGFQHRDYALRNAAWYIADFTADLLETSADRKEGFLDTYTMFREGATRKTEASAEENSAEVKRAGKFLGADAIGICDYDERWVYTHNYSRQKLTDKEMDLPDDLSHVVVIANEMDHETIQTVPSALSGAATGQGYSRDIIAVLSLTQYIRNLGYRAVASLNDTALSHSPGDSSRPGSIRSPRPLDHARVRSTRAHRQDLHRLAPDRGRANRFRRHRNLQHLPPLQRRLPGQSHSQRRAQLRYPRWRLPRQGHQEVDDQRQTMLHLLGQSRHRLFDLHPRLPLQQRLFQAGQSHAALDAGQ